MECFQFEMYVCIINRLFPLFGDNNVIDLSSGGSIRTLPGKPMTVVQSEECIGNHQFLFCTEINQCLSYHFSPCPYFPR